MAWSDPKTWTADDLLTASDLNQYVSDNLSALYALVQGGGQKNLLQNGSMAIRQRGSSTAGITTSGYYTADRWWAGINGVGTWTQSVAAEAPSASGVRSSLKMLITSGHGTPAAGDFVRVAQRIEGKNLQLVKAGMGVVAQELTLSCWVKSNKTGVYVAELYDEANATHVCATYTITDSGTWQEVEITFPKFNTADWPDNASRVLDVVFWLVAGTDWTSGTLDTTWSTVEWEGASPGTTADNNRAAGQVNLAAASNNYWQVTGVQLEVGSAATGFEFKDYGTELRECQRYYEVCQFVVNAAGQLYQNVFYKVNKRSDTVNLAVSGGSITPAVLTNRSQYYFTVDGLATSNAVVAVTASADL